MSPDLALVNRAIVLVLSHMTIVDQSSASFEKHCGPIVLLLSSIYSSTLYIYVLETKQFYAVIPTLFPWSTIFACCYFLMFFGLVVICMACSNCIEQFLWLEPDS